MTTGFYSERLSQNYQIDVVTPEQDDCCWLDQLIFSDLCHGRFSETARQGVLSLIESLKHNGADAIALACTELPLLLNADKAHELPLFDTGKLHCEFAVDWSLTN